LIRESIPQELPKTLIVKSFLLLYFLRNVIFRYLGHQLIKDFPKAESFIEKLIGESTLCLRYFKAI
jgi:hypothetical protein